MNISLIHKRLAEKQKKSSQRPTFIMFMSLLLSSCGTPNQNQVSEPASQVIVAPVLIKDVNLLDEFNGRIEAVQNVSLRARVSGYIDKVNFKEGQLVKKGEVLFSIDDREYKAALLRARADLQRAKSQVEVSRSELDRAERLVTQQATSLEIFEQRKAASEQAKADYLAAEAALTEASLKLEWTQVKAPIAGRASRTLFTDGNLVSPENILTTVVSQETVYVYFDPDETSYRKYSQTLRSFGKGESIPVRVKLVGEDTFTHSSHVDFFDNQMIRGTGTISVRATLSNAKNEFTPGQFAKVQLIGEKKHAALLIDEKSILTDQDRKYVYIVNNAGVAERRDVELGKKVDEYRIINSGLIESDRVVVGGVHRILSAGIKVDAKVISMETGHRPFPTY